LISFSEEKGLLLARHRKKGETLNFGGGVGNIARKKEKKKKEKKRAYNILLGEEREPISFIFSEKR